MPTTPDRFPGSREEDEIILEEQSTDPVVAGAVRYVNGRLKIKDNVGAYDPREEGTGFDPDDILTSLDGDVLVNADGNVLLTSGG